MTCRRCQGCMARDHFLDLQESGGEWWLEGWRCINCGHVFDPVLENNRRMHAALTRTELQPRLLPSTAEAPEDSVDLAA
jgi:rubredoxin